MESKSLKLYLNSFNMSRFGKTTKECLEICKKHYRERFERKTSNRSKVNFLENNSPRVEIFSKFQNIMELVDESKIKNRAIQRKS